MATALTPRRGMRIMMWGVLGLVGCALLGVVALVLTLCTPWGERLLARELPALLNPLWAESGLHVELTGLRGPLPSHLTLTGLRVSDAEGLWLEVPELTVELHPLALWERRIDFQAVRVRAPHLLRLPRLPLTPPPAAPTAVPLTLPQLLPLLPAPWALHVQAFSLSTVQLAPAVLAAWAPGVAPDGLEFDLAGSLHAAGDMAESQLTTTWAGGQLGLRLDCRDGQIRLRADGDDTRALALWLPELLPGATAGLMLDVHMPWPGDTATALSATVDVSIFAGQPDKGVAAFADASGTLPRVPHLRGTQARLSGRVAWDGAQARADALQLAVAALQPADAGQAAPAFAPWASVQGHAVWTAASGALSTQAQVDVPDMRTAAHGVYALLPATASDMPVPQGEAQLSVQADLADAELTDTSGAVRLQLRHVRWPEERAAVAGLLGEQATLGAKWTQNASGIHVNAVSFEADNVHMTAKAQVQPGSTVGAGADTLERLIRYGVLDAQVRASVQELARLTAVLAPDVAHRTDVVSPTPFASGSLNAELTVRGPLTALTPAIGTAAASPLHLSLTVDSPRLTVPTGVAEAVRLDVQAAYAALSHSSGAAQAQGESPAAVTAAVLVSLAGSSGQVHLQAARVQGAPLRATARWQGTREGLRLDGLDAAVLGLRVQGQVDARAAQSAAALPRLDGRVHVDVTDWAMVSRLVALPIRARRAGLDLRLTGGGQAASAPTKGQQVQLVLTADELNMPGTARLRSLRGEVGASDIFGIARVTAQLDAGAGQAASMQWEAASVHAELLPAALKDGRQSVRFDAALRGPLSARFSGAGQSASADIASGWTVQLEQARVDDADRKLGVRLVRPAQLRVGPELRISDVELAMLPQGTATLQAQADAHSLLVQATVQQVPLALARLLGAPAALPDGLVAVRLDLHGSPSAPQGSVHMDVTDIGFAGQREDAPAVRLSLDGQLRKPGSARVAMLDLALRVSTGSSAADMNSAPATVAGQSAPAPDGVLTAEAAVPLVVELVGTTWPVPVPGLALHAPVSGHVQWQGDVQPLWHFVPLPGRNLRGVGMLRGSLGGTLAQPELHAELFLTRASFVDLIAGVHLTDMELEARTHNGRRTELRLRAGDGKGGQLAAAGTLLASEQGMVLDAQGALTNMQPLRRDDLELNLSGTFAVSGSLQEPQVRADVLINQGAYLIMDGQGDSVRTLDVSELAQPCAVERPAPVGNAGNTARTQRSAAPGKAEVSGGAAQTAAGGVPDEVGTVPVNAVQEQLHVIIRAPRRLFIRGKGLESEWQADLLVAGRLDAPHLTGNLAPIRGRFDLLNREFVIGQQGQGQGQGGLTFTGAWPPNPLLDVSMSYQGASLTAMVTVVGPARSPRLVLSSQPPLPQDEVMSHILFGKEFSALSRLETLQVANAARELAGIGPAGGLGALEALRSGLGLAVLRVGSQAAGPSQRKAGRDASMASEAQGQETAPMLEAGKYVFDNVYVGVEQGIDVNTTGVRVEVELLPNMSVEGRSSEISNSIGLNWKKDY